MKPLPIWEGFRRTRLAARLRTTELWPGVSVLSRAERLKSALPDATPDAFCEALVRIERIGSCGGSFSL
jgi:hypothetical protein